MLEQEIKKLQQTIDQQLQSSPLHKKLKQSQAYFSTPQHKEKPSNNKQHILKTSQVGVGDSSVLTHKKNSLQNSAVTSRHKVSSRQIIPKQTQQQKAQQKKFLLNQNKLLKEQTLNLIEQLDSLLSATDKNPKKYGINIFNEEQTQEEKLKKVVIRNQQIKILGLEQKINYEKRQLQYVYDDLEVAKQQAENRILQKQLKNLELEKRSISNILRQQNKGIQAVQMTPQFREKFNKTKEQLERIKQQCKVIQSKTAENQKILLKKHQKSVSKQVKLKRIEKSLKQHQQKNKKPTQIVTIEMISEIQEQIAELQQEREISEKSWNEKLRNLESQLQSRKLQEEKKTLILKDKEKEARLNELRIKQLKKLAVSQLADKRKTSMSGDQGTGKLQNAKEPPGRKRNIIFMEGSRQRNSQSMREVLKKASKQTGNQVSNQKNSETVQESKNE